MYAARISAICLLSALKGTRSLQTLPAIQRCSAIELGSTGQSVVGQVAVGHWAVFLICLFHASTAQAPIAGQRARLYIALAVAKDALCLWSCVLALIQARAAVLVTGQCASVCSRNTGCWEAATVS